MNKFEQMVMDREAQLSEIHSEQKSISEGKIFNFDSEFFMNEVPELGSINLEIIDENDLFQFGMDSFKRKSDNSIPFWEKDLGLDGLMDLPYLKKIEQSSAFGRED